MKGPRTTGLLTKTLTRKAVPSREPAVWSEYRGQPHDYREQPQDEQRTHGLVPPSSPAPPPRRSGARGEEEEERRRRTRKGRSEQEASVDSARGRDSRTLRPPPAAVQPSLAQRPLKLYSRSLEKNATDKENETQVWFSYSGGRSRARAGHPREVAPSSQNPRGNCPQVIFYPCGCGGFAVEKALEEFFVHGNDMIITLRTPCYKKGQS